MFLLIIHIKINLYRIIDFIKKFALIKYILQNFFASFRSNISTGDSSNISNCGWDWSDDAKQTGKTITSKRQPKTEKEESLINFETDNKAQQNWNSKTEDDAWEILNN